MSNQCRECGQEIPPEAIRVSVSGMYDMHLFKTFKGSTVDEIIDAWREHNSTPNPAIVGDREVDDLGPASLCPVRVLGPKGPTWRQIELRSVGPMVFPGDDAKLEEWRQAVSADPDIPRLLSKGGTDDE